MRIGKMNHSSETRPIATPDSTDGRLNVLQLAPTPLVLAPPDTSCEEEGRVGFIHSFESAGTLDGPGIRFVIFMTGCPLRCLYCHNPDTWRLSNGLQMTGDEVFSEIEKYADFLIRWRSGVTVSGGEPLSQPAFLANLLRRCKQRGLHTAIDTSGFLAHRMTSQMIEDTDLVLLDLKAFDDQLHRHLTGASAKKPREFAQRLAEQGKPMWIRFVLVPGLTDDPRDIDQLARFTASLSAVERVEVLPFHKMGESKWRSMGMDYRLDHTPPPEPELIERVIDQFRQYGLETY